MKVICEINDKILLGQEGRSDREPRLTARAIVRSHDGRYAVMHSHKFRLYSLPGGGVEEGEDIITALYREIHEETGCICERIDELGIVYENRACQDYTQESYYFVVLAARKADAPSLTDVEKSSNTAVEWHTFDEMWKLICDATHDTVQRIYLQARDVAALHEYKNNNQFKF